MTQKAYVFIENMYPLVLARRAVMAKEKGYHTVLISPALSEQEKKAIHDFETQKNNNVAIWDQYFTTDDFDLDTLRGFLAQFEEETPAAAFMTSIGMFHRGELVGSNVALLCEERGLPSPNSDAVFRCNNKFLMRDALRDQGVPTVDFGLATDEVTAVEHANRIGYPVILKPLNGAASHMIVKCTSDEDLVNKFRDAMVRLPNSTNLQAYKSAHSYPTRDGVVIDFDPLRSMLIEQYIPGREASVELLITEDQIFPLLVHDKVTMSEKERCFYEHLLVVPPQRFTDEEVQEMKDYAVAVAKAVGLKNTFSHVELRYGENGMGPQLLEINPRIGGMYVQDSIKAMVGIDSMSTCVELGEGTFQAEAEYKSSEEIHAMFTIYPPHSGLLEQVDGLEELEKLPGMLMSKQTMPNGVVIHAEDEECFAVMCFLKAESYEKVYEIYDQALEIVKFTVNPNITSKEEAANV
ncbi:ATP-grasp domain-containing protein [Tumebacillus sp. BK434]|uniref:ATP-grasp domain-containing protein n=1 Tax=Tumebacillus sp. BK434 TaxID=2512169 RepID=UPI0010528CDC|nr:ATP-grasp domain-containing protein [Tumebacillus sp. BK434]TCP55887.1 ATP-grasp domain-containing protein [Tumebacillus sp. BK434]